MAGAAAGLPEATGWRPVALLMCSSEAWFHSSTFDIKGLGRPRGYTWKRFLGFLSRYPL
jgi:hypothetical protein